MRHFFAFLVITVFISVSLPVELFAQGKGGGRGQGPKTTATHGPKTTASRGGKTTSARAPKTTPARGAKSTAGRAPKTTTRGPESTTVKGAPKASEATRTTTAATSTTTASALPKNPKLVERLRTLLKDNPDMNEAATGFRNQGQFVAAVHASANHGLSFTDLKKRMVDENMSLGQAIKDLRTNIDGDAAASRAVQQANQDLATASPKRRTRQ